MYGVGYRTEVITAVRKEINCSLQESCMPWNELPTAWKFQKKPSQLMVNHNLREKIRDGWNERSHNRRKRGV